MHHDADLDRMMHEMMHDITMQMSAEPREHYTHEASLGCRAGRTAFGTKAARERPGK